MDLQNNFSKFFGAGAPPLPFRRLLRLWTRKIIFPNFLEQVPLPSPSPVSYAYGPASGTEFFVHNCMDVNDGQLLIILYTRCVEDVKVESRLSIKDGLSSHLRSGTKQRTIKTKAPANEIDLYIARP